MFPACSPLLPHPPSINNATTGSTDNTENNVTQEASVDLPKAASTNLAMIINGRLNVRRALELASSDTNEGDIVQETFDLLHATATRFLTQAQQSGASNATSNCSTYAKTPSSVIPPSASTNTSNIPDATKTSRDINKAKTSPSRRAASVAVEPPTSSLDAVTTPPESKGAWGTFASANSTAPVIQKQADALSFKNKTLNKKQKNSKIKQKQQAKPNILEPKRRIRATPVAVAGSAGRLPVGDLIQPGKQPDAKSSPFQAAMLGATPVKSQASVTINSLFATPIKQKSTNNNNNNDNNKKVSTINAWGNVQHVNKPTPNTAASLAVAASPLVAKTWNNAKSSASNAWGQSSTTTTTVAPSPVPNSTLPPRDRSKRIETNVSPAVPPANPISLSSADREQINNLADWHAALMKRGSGICMLDQVHTLAMLLTVTDSPLSTHNSKLGSNQPPDRILNTAAHCHAFACAVLERLPDLVIGLGPRSCRYLCKLNYVSQDFPILFAVATKYSVEPIARMPTAGDKDEVGIDKSIRRTDSAEFSVPFQESTDSRLHFTTPELRKQYQNREVVRDLFINGIRAWHNSNNSSTAFHTFQQQPASETFSGGVKQQQRTEAYDTIRVSAINCMRQLSSANLAWFVRLFVLELELVCTQEQREHDEDVLELAKDRAKLDRLHRRMAGPSDGAIQTVQTTSSSASFATTSSIGVAGAESTKPTLGSDSFVEHEHGLSAGGNVINKRSSQRSARRSFLIPEVTPSNTKSNAHDSGHHHKQSSTRIHKQQQHQHTRAGGQRTGLRGNSGHADTHSQQRANVSDTVIQNDLLSTHDDALCKLFTRDELFFARFILALDSYAFNALLLDALLARAHKLCIYEQTHNGVTADTVVAVKVIGKVLGLVEFVPRWALGAHEIPALGSELHELVLAAQLRQAGGVARDLLHFLQTALFRNDNNDSLIGERSISTPPRGTGSSVSVSVSSVSARTPQKNQQQKRVLGLVQLVPLTVSFVRMSSRDPVAQQSGWLVLMWDCLRNVHTEMLARDELVGGNETQQHSSSTEITSRKQKQVFTNGRGDTLVARLFIAFEIEQLFIQFGIDLHPPAAKSTPAAADTTDDNTTSQQKSQALETRLEPMHDVSHFILRCSPGLSHIASLLGKAVSAEGGRIANRSGLNNSTGASSSVGSTSVLHAPSRKIRPVLQAQDERIVAIDAAIAAYRTPMPRVHDANNLKVGLSTVEGGLRLLREVPATPEAEAFQTELMHAYLRRSPNARRMVEFTADTLASCFSDDVLSASSVDESDLQTDNNANASDMLDVVLNELARFSAERVSALVRVAMAASARAGVAGAIIHAAQRAFEHSVLPMIRKRVLQSKWQVPSALQKQEFDSSYISDVSCLSNAIDICGVDAKNDGEGSEEKIERTNLNELNVLLESAFSESVQDVMLCPILASSDVSFDAGFTLTQIDKATDIVSVTKWSRGCTDAALRNVGAISLARGLGLVRLSPLLRVSTGGTFEKEEVYLKCIYGLVDVAYACAHELEQRTVPLYLEVDNGPELLRPWTGKHAAAMTFHVDMLLNKPSRFAREHFELLAHLLWRWIANSKSRMMAREEFNAALSAMRWRESSMQQCLEALLMVRNQQEEGYQK